MSLLLEGHEEPGLKGAHITSTHIQGWELITGSLDARSLGTAGFHLPRSQQPLR